MLYLYGHKFIREGNICLKIKMATNNFPYSTESKENNIRWTNTFERQNCVNVNSFKRPIKTGNRANAPHI